MRNVLKTTMIAFAMTIGAAAMQGAHMDVVNVPFEFVANGVQLPAGTYRLENDSTFVRLTNNKGKSVAMLPYGGVSLKPKGSKTRLVLKQQNGRMHLVAVGDSSANILRSVASGS